MTHLLNTNNKTCFPGSRQNKSLILDLSRGYGSFLNPMTPFGWCPFEVINAICTTQSCSHISQPAGPNRDKPWVIDDNLPGDKRGLIKFALPATIRRLCVKFPAEARNYRPQEVVLKFALRQGIPPATAIHLPRFYCSVSLNRMQSDTFFCGPENSTNLKAWGRNATQ